MPDKPLPLVDLHHHLDGSVRLQTILEVGLQYDLPLPAKTLIDLKPFVQVTGPQPGVMAFIEKFKWMTGILVNYDICRRIARENVEDAWTQGITYIELRFSPWFMAEAHTLDPTHVTEAVLQGIREGSQTTGVKANAIGILSRHYGPEIAMQELKCLLTFKNQLIGLDLAGDEAHFPGDWFVEHFKIARDAGWNITVHAGEAAGASSIWQAILGLGAQRIGHGVRAIDDLTLMEYMAKKGISIEVNLTSNVQTSTVPSYAGHPAKQFLEQGIPISLNTDDPGISGIDLPYEYAVAAPAAGFTQDQIIQLKRNAIQTAFLSTQDKLTLLA